MPIWRLHPSDLTDPNWEASSHRGVAVVRARSEKAARAAAQKAFGVKTRFPTSHRLAAPPWTRPELVTAEIIADHSFDEDGPEEVLDPSFTADLAPTPRRR